MKKFLYGCGGVMAAALIYFLLSPVFAGEIVLRPEFKLGDFAIHYYGIILGMAVLAGYWVVRQNAWRYGLSVNEADRVTFWTLIASIISARIYFVLFAWNYFTQYPGEIYKFWNGGISIYGALIGGLGFILLFARKKIYSVKQVLDLAALAMPLGQAIGRFGNLFNYEAYGSSTNLPWGMFVPEEHRIISTAEFYHPTFLYEAISSLAIFVLLLSLRGKVRTGNLALIYLAGYGVTRFALEFIRIDSVLVGGWRVDQVVSLLVILVAGVLFIANKPQQK